MPDVLENISNTFFKGPQSWIELLIQSCVPVYLVTKHYCKESNAVHWNKRKSWRWKVIKMLSVQHIKKYCIYEEIKKKYIYYIDFKKTQQH